MRNQFSVPLALTICMLLGFLCESSDPSCESLRRCARRVSRTNFFFTYVKFTVAQFLSEIERVCANADLDCTRHTDRCTNETVLNDIRLVKKVREFLCSDEGREEAKEITQVDTCAGNTAEIRRLEREHSQCMRTYAGSMSGVNCTAVEEARECINRAVRNCSEHTALFMDHAFTYRTEVFWPSCAPGN